MEYLFAALPGLLATGILGFILSRKEQQIEKLIDTAAKERAQLIAQVQRPDISPTIAIEPEIDGGPMHIPYDDDEANAEYMEKVRAGELA